MAPPPSLPGTAPGLAEDPIAELRRQNGRLRAICDLGDALIGEPPLPAIYDAAIAALDAALGPDRASILRIDPDGVMRFKAWRGLSDAYRAATDGHSPWTAETRDPEPLLVEDAAAFPEFSDELRRVVLDEGIRALAFIPVVYQGRLLGKFMLYFDRPHRFADEEVRIARTIAGHIAFALARANADEELARSRDELAIILRDVADGITVQAPDGSIVYANPAAARLTGFESVDVLLTTPIADLMRRFELFDEHGNPFPLDRLPGRLALRGEYPPDVICRFRVAESGEERWSIVKATPVFGEGGRVEQAINVFVDITERRQAEEASSRLAAIVQSSDDAILSKDLDGTILSWNDGAERLYGYTAQEIIGRSVAVLMPPELPDELPDIMARLRDNLPIEHYETQRVCKDGRRVDVSVSISPIRDPSGRVVGAATIARDVTAQKRADRLRRFLTEATTLLAGSLDYQATLAQVADLAVPDLADWCTVSIVEGGTVREIAVAHADPTKVQWARQLRERGLSDPSEDEGLLRVIRSGRAELYPLITDDDLVAVAKDDEQLRLLREVGFSSAMIVPLTARGRTLGALVLVAAESGRRYDEQDLAIAEDIAWRAALAVDNARLYQDERQARESAELARDQAQDAIRVRDEFLSVASHELRTPLTSLQAYAQLALRRGQREGGLDPERAGRALEEINRQAQRLGSLISQLLDISRLQAGRLVLESKLLDLVPLVEQVVRTARSGAGARHIGLRRPERLTAMVDGLRLEQVLTNLIDNAIKYSPAGTPIEVTLALADPETIELAVRDHGSGIPLDRRAAIFQRYYRAHADSYQSGLGLGLYISRQIVELHGGTIAAEFPEDGGSRFVVRLPLVTELTSA